MVFIQMFFLKIEWIQILFRYLIPFVSSLFGLLSNYFSYQFPKSKIHWFHCFVLTLFYLVSAVIDIYVLTLIQENMNRYVKPLQVILGFVCVIISFIFCKMIVYDDVLDILVYLKEHQFKIKGQKISQYKKPQSCINLNVPALALMCLMILGFVVFIQIRFTRAQTLYEIALLLGFLIIIPFWLGLGYMIKKSYIRKKSLILIWQIIVPFLLITSFPILATVFRNYLYIQKSTELLALFFYIFPLSYFYWILTCHNLYTNRLKFLFGCSIQILLSLFPIAFLLPYSGLTKDNIKFWISIGLLSAWGINNSVFFLLKIKQLCLQHQGLSKIFQSLALFRQIIKKNLNNIYEQLYYYYKTFSIFCFVSSYSISLFAFSYRSITQNSNDQIQQLLIAIAATSVFIQVCFQSINFYQIRINNQDQKISLRKLHILFFVIIISVISILIIIAFLLQLPQKYLLISIGTFIASLVACVTFFIKNYEQSPKISLIIHTASWAIFQTLFVAALLFAFKQRLGINREILLYWFVAGFFMATVAIVTLIGFIVHNLLNLSEQYRKFILLQNLITEAMRPFNIIPQEPAIIQILTSVQGDMNLKQIQDILLKNQKLSIQSRKSNFALSVSEKPIKFDTANDDQNQYQQEEQNPAIFELFKKQYQPQQKLTFWRFNDCSKNLFNQSRQDDILNSIKYSETRRLKLLSTLWRLFSQDYSDHESMMNPKDFRKILLYMFNLQKIILQQQKQIAEMIQDTINISHSINLSQFSLAIYRVAFLLYGRQNQQNMKLLLIKSFSDIYRGLESLGLSRECSVNEKIKFYGKNEIKDYWSKLKDFKQKKKNLKQQYLQYIMDNQFVISAESRMRNTQKVSDLNPDNQIKSTINKKPPKKQLIINKIAFVCLQMFREMLIKQVSIEQISWSFSNLVMILTKISDYITIFSQIPINVILKQVFNQITVTKLTTSYDFNFAIGLWISLFVALLYFFIVYKSADDIKNNTLGINENGQKCTYQDKKFWFALLLNFLSNTLCDRMIVYTLYSNICSSKTVQKFVLEANPAFECLTPFQSVLILISILLLITYYPLAIIISPISINIDRSLTVKYKTEFSVIYMQSKIIIASINIFTKYQDFKFYIISNASAGLLITSILALVFWRMQPSLLKVVNTVEFRFILLSVLINLTSFTFLFQNLWIGYISIGSVILIYGLINLLLFMNRSQRIDIQSQQNYYNNITKKQNRQRQIKQNGIQKQQSANSLISEDG